MATFRKPNMSKINSQLNKMKTASRQFERDANRAINELKSVERKAKIIPKQASIYVNSVIDYCAVFVSWKK